MSGTREYEEAAERLDALLDISDCTELESIEARRSELLEAQEDFMVLKAMASEELTGALDRFKSGRGGTSYKARQEWVETINRCKADMFAINSALHGLRARELASAKFDENSARARSPSADLYRVGLHFVALAETALDAAVFRALLGRARALAATRAKIRSPSIEGLAEELKASIAKDQA